VDINDNFFVERKELLEDNEYEVFFQRIEERITDRDNWNRELLEGFIFNIIQLLSSRLLELNIQADKLFDREIIQSMMKAYSSIDETLRCLEQLKNKMCLLSERKKQESKIVNDIKEYIRDNIESKLTRKEIADQVYLSPDYLTKLFRKETGMTIIEFVTEEKVNVAKRMIGQDNIPIGEVAQRLGYENFSYFSEIFRKKTGKSPSEYKRKSEL
jgi:two-component system response regulator YesN